MKTLKPLGKWVLVNVISAEQSVGGLVLPETANKDKYQQYIVIAVGDEVTKVKTGDEIFIAGNIFKLDYSYLEKGLALIMQDNILGVLSK